MNNEILIKIEITRPHGTYWVAHATTTDGNNDVAFTGVTPLEATEKVTSTLTWFGDTDWPNVQGNGPAR